MKGRKPKPHHLKQLMGNPGKRPLKPPPKGRDGRMPCPSWLDTEAKRQWGIVTKQLRAMGILAQSDVGIIASYCQTLSRLQEAQKAIHQHGITLPTVSGGFKKNPCVGILEKCVDTLRQLSGELGLSPTSRERLSVTLPPPDDGKEKFFDKYPQRDKWKGLLG